MNPTLSASPRDACRRWDEGRVRFPLFSAPSATPIAILYKRKPATAFSIQYSRSESLANSRRIACARCVVMGLRVPQLAATAATHARTT